MFIILLVTLSSLSSAGVLALWMALTGFNVSRIDLLHDVSLWQR
jgi:hypothetical protein